MYPLFTILLIIKYILPHLLRVIIKTSPIYQIILDLVKHITIELETQFMLMEKELNKFIWEPKWENYKLDIIGF